MRCCAPISPGWRRWSRLPARASTERPGAKAHQRTLRAWWFAESDFPARDHVGPQGLDLFRLQQAAPGRHLVFAARHRIDEALALAAREFPQVGGALRVEHARAMAR